MPQESNTVVDSLVELLVSALSVGVAHIVEHSDRESSIVTSSMSSSEAQNVGDGGAVGRHDLVVVGGTSPEAGDLNVVEEL